MTIALILLLLCGTAWASGYGANAGEDFESVEKTHHLKESLIIDWEGNPESFTNGPYQAKKEKESFSGAGYQIGFRSDGVCVWRKIIPGDKEKT